MATPNPYAVAAISVLGGWILAQFAAAGKDWVYRRYLRRAILDELRQLRDEVIRLHWNYARAVQLWASGGVQASAPLPLSNVIFSNHYKDAVLAFSRVQRIALQMVHNYIRTLNSGAEELHQLERSIYKKKVAEEVQEESDFKLHGDMVRSLFRMVRVTQWHIDHYLQNPLFPVLEGNDQHHKEYLQFLDSIEEELKKIERSGIGIPKEKFEKYSMDDEGLPAA